MCQRQTAWYRPCGRVHISEKCPVKRNCPLWKRRKEVEKKISSRIPKCETCRGVPLHKQVWHWLEDWFRWLFTKSGMSRIGKNVAWTFWIVFAGLKRTLSSPLGEPKARGAAWRPKGFWKRVLILICAAMFFGLVLFCVNKAIKTFGWFQTYVPWYNKLFWAITYPLRISTRQTWNQLTGPHRGMVEKVLYRVWDHTPAEVRAVCHFSMGVLQYYISWTWCEMKCSLFVQNGYMRGVRVKGCRWECFNNL